MSIHIPRLTAYLLFGLLAGHYLGDYIDTDFGWLLSTLTGLATTLIALIAGLSLNVARLGRRFRAIARLTASTLLISLTVLLALAVLAWPWLPIAPDASGMPRLAMALLFALILVSFSPTMTVAVTAQTGARGRLSELVLAMVIMADLAVLVLFSLGMQFARFAFAADDAPEVSLLARLAWEVVGALAFGTLLGALFALYLRYVARHTALVLVGVCLLLSQVGTTQEFEPLLAAMAAGLTIENLAVSQGDALKAAVQRSSKPVLLVFFVAIGSSLRLDAIPIVGGVAVVVAVVRTLVISLGLRAGLALVPLHKDAGYAWTGLISQAGITLGFASVLANEFPGWGGALQLLLVAVIAFNELVGPLMFRQGLKRAGELDPEAPRPLLVVSNREPFLHSWNDDGTVTASAATGGVAVALDALMRERGGVWIAHGAGSADDAVVDAADKVMVPPDAPSYTLRRLWLQEPMFSAYYGGFANEGLWPLCHQVDVRPHFRSEDWAAYEAVNERFAAAIDQELTSESSPVFIQDYHLARVAPRLRARRPEARTALFWHIPWPYPDRLRICPWRRELLAGLLANDLVAFQLERDRRHFLLAADEELGADIEEESSTVRFEGRSSTIVSVPIGVDYDRIQRIAADAQLAAEQRRLAGLFRLHGQVIGIGVDRLDYTKGIPERVAALDAVLTRRPELRGRLTFVQIGVPSRSDLSSYEAIEAEIGARIAEVNARHFVPGGAVPIRYHTEALSMTSLVALYRLARFCVVSSLHDGMNLVAKEFVASRDDEDGVLVLSALAGAAQELESALIINPYDVDGFAAALLQAIDMGADERRMRMRAMRRIVAGRNVFGWASDILEGLESLWTKPLQYSVRASQEAPV